MNSAETITKLRKLTAANGATPEEERRAAEKIGKLLMAHPEIHVMEPTIQQIRTKDEAWQAHYEELRRRAEALRERGASFGFSRMSKPFEG